MQDLGDRLMKLVFRGVKLAGYMAYGLLVCVFFLWFLFPSTYVQEWPERYINARFPNIRLILGEVRYRFPFRLSCTRSLILNRSAQTPIVELQEVKGILHVQDIFHPGNISMDYSAELYGGTVQGQVVPVGDALHVTALIERIEVERMNWLSKEVQRKVSGRVQGNMEIHLGLQTGRVRSLTGKLHAVDGSIELKTPVFGLTTITYDTLDCSVQGDGERLAVYPCRLNSELFDVEFKEKSCRLDFSAGHPWM